MQQLGGEDDVKVKSVLIERNLRLVVYIVLHAYSSFNKQGGSKPSYAPVNASNVMPTKISLYRTDVSPKLISSYPWQMLVWSVGMAYALLKLGGKWIESHIQRRREFCTISGNETAKQYPRFACPKARKPSGTPEQKAVHAPIRKK